MSSPTTVDVLLFPAVSPSIISTGRTGQGEPRLQPVDADAAKVRRRHRYDYREPDATAKKKKDDVKEIKGGERIKKWVEAGGTVVALDSSSQYFIDLFELPVNDVLAKVDGDDFNCPGSTLRVEMNMDSPLSFGMQAEEAIYFGDSPAFQTRVPDPRFERTVVARYPDDDKDILLSGYLAGGKLLRKARRGGGNRGRQGPRDPHRFPRPAPRAAGAHLQAACSIPCTMSKRRNSRSLI